MSSPNKHPRYKQIKHKNSPSSTPPWSFNLDNFPPMFTSQPTSPAKTDDLSPTKSSQSPFSKLDKQIEFGKTSFGVVKSSVITKNEIESLQKNSMAHFELYSKSNKLTGIEKEKQKDIFVDLDLKLNLRKDSNSNNNNNNSNGLTDDDKVTEETKKKSNINENYGSEINTGSDESLVIVTKSNCSQDTATADHNSKNSSMETAKTSPEEMYTESKLEEQSKDQETASMTSKSPLNSNSPISDQCVNLEKDTKAVQEKDTHIGNDVNLVQVSTSQKDKVENNKKQKQGKNDIIGSSDVMSSDVKIEINTKNVSISENTNISKENVSNSQGEINEMGADINSQVSSSTNDQETKENSKETSKSVAETDKPLIPTKTEDVVNKKINFISPTDIIKNLEEVRYPELSKNIVEQQLEKLYYDMEAEFNLVNSNSDRFDLFVMKNKLFHKGIDIIPSRIETLQNDVDVKIMLLIDQEDRAQYFSQQVQKICEKQALAQLIANSTKAGDKTPQLSPYILDLQKTITKNKETLEKSLGIAESDINALKLTVKESISRDRSFKSIKKSINLVSDGLKEKLREVESLNNELEMLVRMLKDNPNYNKQEKKKILFNLNDKKREGRIALAKLLRSKHSSVV